MLISLRNSLNKAPNRYFVLPGSPSLFIYLQDSENKELTRATRKAASAAIALNTRDILAIFVGIDVQGDYVLASRFEVEIPNAKTPENQEIYNDSKAMESRFVNFDSVGKDGKVKSPRKIGRNERCWCGSGIKYKKCHGC